MGDGQSAGSQPQEEQAAGSPTEDALAQERAILSEVVACTPAAIALVWGPEHRVRLLNDRWMETFPRVHQAGGRPLGEVLPDAAAVIRPFLDRVRNTGEPFRGTDMPLPVVGPPAGAGYRYFTLTMSPVSGRGAGAGIDGVLIVGNETTEDVRRRRQLEQELATERGIADVLQRSLLPSRFPDLPGVTFAVRYVAAGTDLEVGGDWYDVIPLGGDRVGLVIGDVAGHGVQAASTMGQLRHALRAYAADGHSPAGVLQRLDRLLEPQGQIATVLYAVFTVGTGRLVSASAGHPPAVVVAPDGSAQYLSGREGTPLGTGLTGTYEETVTQLAPNAVLVLFTDGLVEDRGSSIHTGLERLRRVAAQGAADPEVLCDRLLSALRPGGSGRDDMALLALKAVPLPRDRLRLQFPAKPAVLSTVRASLQAWLRGAGAGETELYEIITAVCEACINAVEHAYALAPGVLEIEAVRRDRDVVITVRDQGTWRPQRGMNRGHGLAVMRAMTDAVEIERTSAGTIVLLRRRLPEQLAG